LRDLEAEWNALFATARDIHVFQSFKWSSHWVNHSFPPTSTTKETAVSTSSPDVATARWRCCTRSSAIVARADDAEFRWRDGQPIRRYADRSCERRVEMLDRVWAYAIVKASSDVVALRKVRADANFVSVLERQQAVVTER
jgi:hypothetical protein